MDVISKVLRSHMNVMRLPLRTEKIDEAQVIFRLCYDICNTMDSQRIIQSTPAIFSFKSWTMDVVITVGKVRASNADRRVSFWDVLGPEPPFLHNMRCIFKNWKLNF
jgi:hypothetical protein